MQGKQIKGEARFSMAFLELFLLFKKKFQLPLSSRGGGGRP